jgi:hypothetical protein
MFMYERETAEARGRGWCDKTRLRLSPFRQSPSPTHHASPLAPHRPPTRSAFLTTMARREYPTELKVLARCRRLRGGGSLGSLSNPPRSSSPTPAPAARGVRVKLGLGLNPFWVRRRWGGGPPGTPPGPPGRRGMRGVLVLGGWGCRGGERGGVKGVLGVEGVYGVKGGGRSDWSETYKSIMHAGRLSSRLESRVPLSSTARDLQISTSREPSLTS